MKCQFCANPATVHLTDIIDQHKKEMHLCEACARQHHVLPGPQQDLNLPALLHLLLGQTTAPLTAEDAQRTCPACGLSYGEFRQAGRLGCPHDYLAFRAELAPLLERIHRSTRHVGKAPRRPPDPTDPEEALAVLRRQLADAATLAGLYRQLADAVTAERYEDAARLRDQIRQKETSDEPG
jgi:protein arginine kinase activator